MASSHRLSTDTRRLAAGVLLLPFIVGLVLIAFTWPASEIAPRSLPIGLVGPEQAVSQISPMLTGRGLEISTYADESAARTAIEDRDIYGAIVLASDKPIVLTASAASPVVAQLLQQFSTQLAQTGEQSAPQSVPTVIDVVPTTPDDPRGAVLGASMFPLILGGYASALILSMVSTSGMRRIVGVIAAASGAGMMAALLMQTWLGALDGSWWLNASVFALLILAIASAGLGAIALAGNIGLAVVVVLMLLIGNPLSGITSAPELLPTWAGTLGQLLPPGAGGSLLRSTSFFDGVGSAQPLIVLLCWITVGLGTVLVAGTRLRDQVSVS